MGLLNFFKNLSGQINCDNKITEKDNWQMYGNKMQVLKYNKDIIVQENQICLLRFKDKTCDILECGNYKINQDKLPVIFEKANFNKFNGKAKRFKIKADLYYAKKNNITFDFKYKIKQKINNIKTTEIIFANVIYNVSDIKTLTRFLFLENAVVSTKEYNKLVERELYNYINNQIEIYNGELYDLEDADIALSVKQKTEKEFYSYGIQIEQIKFYEYKNLTKNKQKRVEEINPIIQEVEQPQVQQEQPQQVQQIEVFAPVQQPIYESQYSEAMQTGKITITPDID